MFDTWKLLEERGSWFSGECPALPELFFRAAETDPEKLCFFMLSPAEERCTYGDVRPMITAAAQDLAASGIQPGDRIVLTGKNSPMWAVSYFSILHAGAAAVPIDWQLDSADIARLASFAQAAAVITDEDILSGFPEEIKASCRLISLNEESSMQSMYAVCRQEPGSAVLPARSCDDLAAVMFTSGTTGNEKGVMLTHGNLSPTYS